MSCAPVAQDEQDAHTRRQPATQDEQEPGPSRHRRVGVDRANWYGVPARMPLACPAMTLATSPTQSCSMSSSIVSATPASTRAAQATAVALGKLDHHRAVHRSHERDDRGHVAEHPVAGLLVGRPHRHIDAGHLLERQRDRRGERVQQVLLHFRLNRQGVAAAADLGEDGPARGVRTADGGGAGGDQLGDVLGPRPRRDGDERDARGSASAAAPRTPSAAPAAPSSNTTTPPPARPMPGTGSSAVVTCTSHPCSAAHRSSPSGPPGRFDPITNMSNGFSFSLTNELFEGGRRRQPARAVVRVLGIGNTLEGGIEVQGGFGAAEQQAAAGRNCRATLDSTAFLVAPSK